MSDYPEHDKLSAVSDQTQAAGEFLEWLQSQGVQLMVWREDLTDTRPVDRECPVRRRGHAEYLQHRDVDLPCDPTHDDGPADHLPYWMGHCKHWQHPESAIDGDGQPGTCCRCGKGHVYEVTGIKSYVPERRSVAQLLADCWDIDQDKIEAEKRAMLASLRKAS